MAVFSEESIVRKFNLRGMESRGWYGEEPEVQGSTRVCCQK